MKELDMKVSGDRSFSFVGPSSEHLKFDSLATEMKMGEIHMVYSSISMENHFQQEHRSSSKHQHRPLDLEFSSSQYTHDNEDPLSETILSSMEDLKHSPTADSKDQINWSNPPKDIVLLQSMGGGGLVGKPEPRFGVHATVSDAKHELDSNFSVISCQYDSSNRISEPHSPTDGWSKFLQRERLNQEAEQSGNSTSAKRRLFTEKEFDLNKALPDESSDQCISNLSKVQPSDVSDIGGGKNGKHNFLAVLHRSNATSHDSTEPSSIGQQDVTESTLTVEHKDEKRCSNDSPQELLDSTGSNRSPVSCKSNGIMEDVSSNSKTVSNSNQKREEFGNVDTEVRKGAVSLIYLSLGSSSSSPSRNQDVVKASEKRCNIVKEVPQSSCESYELLVLKQPECSADEWCVSSTPYEMGSCNAKGGGIKVRRGRRMKDFRKDILPNMVSLSTQEIYEDVKIMELAIRSREYRKFNSKSNNKTECPSKRRRSSRGQGASRRFYC